MIIRFHSHSSSYTGGDLAWGVCHIRLEVFELSMPMVAGKTAFGRIFGVCTSFPGPDLSLNICVGNDHIRSWTQPSSIQAVMESRLVLAEVLVIS